MRKIILDKGLTDQEIAESDRIKLEKARQERYLLSTKRIRITSGGSYKDFEELDKAMKYLEKQIKRYANAGVHVIHPELFWNDEPDIKQILEEIQ